VPNLYERLPVKRLCVRDNGALTLEIGPRGWSLRTADGKPAVDSTLAEPGE
jgi:hypothetical protein